MSSTEKVRDALVWIDMEMTGLHPESASVLEIASIVTRADLSIVAEGPDLVVHQPDVVLDGMDAWNTTHHGASGLIAASRESTTTLAAAEQATIDFLGAHVEPASS